MFGPKLVRRIAVDAGGERLELLRSDGDVIETRRSRLSGGIVLKSEPIDTDAWLQALGETLAAEAQRSETNTAGARAPADRTRRTRWGS